MTKLFLRIDFSPDARLGPGKVRLLELIGTTGSISSAGRQIGGMSYQRAWKLVEGLNTMFTEPVITTILGGKGGGGARLTPFGSAMIERYRRFEAETTAAAARQFDDLQPVLRTPAVAATNQPVPPPRTAAAEK